MGFSRQEYWNELPFPSPGHLLDPGIEPGLATRFIHDIIHISMPFSQISPPSPSPTVQRPWGFPGGSDSKVSVCNAGDLGSLGSGRSPGEGYGNSFQYSCLENSMDRGAWWATVHGVSSTFSKSFNLVASVIIHSDFG